MNKTKLFYMLTTFVCLYGLYYLLTDEARRAFKNQSEAIQRRNIIYSNNTSTACMGLNLKVRDVLAKHKDASNPEIQQLKSELEAALNEQ